MSLWKKVQCFFKGHIFTMVEELSDISGRFRCNNCGYEIAVNFMEQVAIPWSPEVAAFFEKRKPIERRESVASDDPGGGTNPP